MFNCWLALVPSLTEIESDVKVANISRLSFFIATAFAYPTYAVIAKYSQNEFEISVDVFHAHGSHTLDHEDDKKSRKETFEHSCSYSKNVEYILNTSDVIL